MLLDYFQVFCKYTYINKTNWAGTNKVQRPIGLITFKHAKLCDCCMSNLHKDICLSIDAISQHLFYYSIIHA